MPHNAVKLIYLLMLLWIAVSPTRFATTAAGQPMRFAMIGDYGYAPDTTGPVAELVRNWDPDFVVTLGDNIYGFGSPGDGQKNLGRWDELVGTYYGELIQARGDQRYPTQTSEETRFFTVPGNHDLATAADVSDPALIGTLGGYLDFFHFDPLLPGGRLPTGTGRHELDLSYYDFVWGDVHFFMMDSPHAISNSTHPQLAEQAEWLRTGLLNSTTPWQFVVMHDPAYNSSFGKPIRPALQMPLQEWGADAVFSGDAHNYERLVITDSMQDSMPYFINGLSGVSFLYPFIDPYPGSEFRYLDQHGALRVTVDDRRALIEFVSVDGQTQDQYELLQDELPEAPRRTGTYLAPAEEATWNTTNQRELSIHEGLLVGSDSGATNQSYLRFDIDDVLVQQFAHDAQARAYVELTYVGAESPPIELYRMTRPWDSGVLKALQPGQDVTSDPTAQIDQFVPYSSIRLDVTDDLRAWAAGVENFGWALLPAEAESEGLYRFRSEQQVVKGPRLILTRQLDQQTYEPLSVVLPGDLNHDWLVTGADLDLLCHAVWEGRDPYSDLQGDGQVDLSDLQTWLTLSGVATGNTDWQQGDADVDSQDLLNLIAGWSGAEGSGRGWRHGNFDCDGDVDSQDLLELIGHWTAASTPVTAVPEPSSGYVLGFAMLVAWCTRRKQVPRRPSGSLPVDRTAVDGGTVVVGISL